MKTKKRTVTAKLIDDREGQIVLIPKRFELKCSEVVIKRRGKYCVSIQPAPAPPAKAKKSAKKK